MAKAAFFNYTTEVSNESKLCICCRRLKRREKKEKRKRRENREETEWSRGGRENVGSGLSFSYLTNEETQLSIVLPDHEQIAGTEKI